MTKILNNKWVYGILAIILATISYLIVPSAEYPQAPIMAAIVVIMAIFWIFEIVPIAITSLFPIFLFPLIDVLVDRCALSESKSSWNSFFLNSIKFINEKSVKIDP